MTFRVVFHSRAQIDIASAVTWLARKSRTGASRWRIGLVRIVENLETSPNQYPTADEATDLGIDLRQLLYGRRPHVYRILFTIDGQTINILRVRHAAQDRIASDDF